MPPDEWDSYLCPDEDDEPNVGPPDEPDEWRADCDDPAREDFAA